MLGRLRKTLDKRRFKRHQEPEPEGEESACSFRMSATQRPAQLPNGIEQHLGETAGKVLEKDASEDLMKIWKEALQRLTADVARLNATDHFSQRPGFEEAFDRMARTQLHATPVTRAMDAAFLPSNEPKNRYCDVLPFDKSRIKLGGRGRSASDGSDYVNASHIEGLRFSKGKVQADEVSKTLPKYVATQGPLENTVADFWEMVLQEGCAAIVMLCKEIELGRPKCAHYFPSRSGTPEVFQHMKVTNVKTGYLQGCKSIVERRFQVVDTRPSGKTSLVSHFHYADWPDHGVPETTGPIRQLMCYLRSNQFPQGPFLVHCSAGIGRTGTYCCVDYAIRRLLAGDVTGIDIPSIIMGLRWQRSGMVQTYEQFHFCYMAVLDELKEVANSKQKP